MEARQIPVCKAIIQEGPRKANQCKFPPLENGYCGRHIRNKIYDDGLIEGKKWCRFFFRGCNNTLEKGLTCDTCKNKKHIGKQMCKHEGCSHHTIDIDYCKKHERDIYYITCQITGMEASTATPIIIKFLNLKPVAKKIVTAMTIRITPVPKSGCFIISKAGSMTPIIGNKIL